MIKIIYSEREKEIEWREGITVEDAVFQFCEACDCDAVRIMGAGLDGRYVGKIEFKNTPVPDGAEIYILPWVVGG